MGFASEFKAFALKGNVMDLAVGVIIGAAFGKIVDSVVNDLIMPVVGRIFGGLDFTNYFIALKEIPPGTVYTVDAVKKAGVPVLAYGNFITIAINFLILAFIIFMMVKQVNRLKKEAPPAAPPATPEDIVLLREIRDSLRK
ncbi:MAG: mscL [Anaeromyxobacteraceae bacterium]|jgi:large conductance mechanosensitive channel|nr:mscL [Anaeromyxobacteraceae bacterium]